MIQAAILSRLSGDATITAAAGTRIYSDYLPQTTSLPAIRFWRVSTFPRELSQSGPIKVATARFQIDCFATDPDAARALGNRVRQLWHAFKGTIGSESILLAKVEAETDPFDLDNGTFSVAIDVIITYRET